MSFKVKANPTFVGTASVHVPGEGPKALKLVFKHKTAEAADEYYRRASDLVADGSQPSSRSFGNYLLEIVEGWKDVDTEFSPDAFVELLSNYPFAARAIHEAYFEALGGARRGN